MLNGEVGDTALCVYPVWSGEGLRGTDIQAVTAAAAMVLFRHVGWKVQRGEHLAEEEPGAVVAGHQVGMLALPAHGRFRGQRFLQHRRGIHIDPGITGMSIAEPAGESLQPLLHYVVIVAAPGIDAEITPVPVMEPRKGVVQEEFGGAVIDPQHDDRLGPVEERGWIAPLGGLFCHPDHVPVKPLFDEGSKVFFHARRELRYGEPHGIEPHLTGPGVDSFFRVLDGHFPTLPLGVKMGYPAPKRGHYWSWYL